MKLDWQWPAAIVFATVFATTGVLVALGKVHAEMLGGLLAWLIPAPWANKPPEVPAAVPPAPWEKPS